MEGENDAGKGVLRDISGVNLQIPPTNYFSAPWFKLKAEPS